MTEPKLMLLMSEVWTMTHARDLRGLAKLAVVAEAAGVDGIMIGEHVAMGPNAGYNGVPENPRDWLGEGTHVPDYAHPHGLHVLGAIAALTSRIRLLAASIISPLRHPLVLGKELVTVDLLAEGRLIFVPTVSWQEEEYAAIGIPFHQRGAILDEQLEVWEQAWSGETVSYDGTHYRFDSVYFEPKAWRPTGPQLWIGGMRLHPAALRRIVRYGSGYFPVLPPSGEDLERLRSGLEAAGRRFEDIELAMLVGLDTPFPDAVSPKALGPALDRAQPHMADGVSTFVIKPSQYIDDRDQLGDFCSEAIAGLRERAAATR
jgi:alkanesulfonate monooxygenase SsuD/methylene tetrahydromethanopterin reductase-like flavin-dependent oxidoreductase (luciferase family)